MFDEGGEGQRTYLRKFDALLILLFSLFSTIPAFPSLAGPYSPMVIQKEGKHQEKKGTSKQNQ